MNVPKISICLLTYKRAAILGATIDSLLHQTFSDFELLINDDCSPDGTEQVCREYLKRDARVRYFRNLRNLRYSGNQNAAVSRAGSDFIAFVHDGDSYAPNMLERWYETLVKHPSAGLVFNAQSTLDLSGHVVRTSSHPYAELIPGRVMFDYVITKPSIPITIFATSESRYSRYGRVSRDTLTAASTGKLSANRKLFIGSIYGESRKSQERSGLGNKPISML